MIVYELGPIDSWRGWQDIDVMFGTPNKDMPHEGPISPLTLVCFAAEAFHAAATHLAWDGDIRGWDIRATVLPGADDPNGLAFLLAWKQNSDATTYIASPHRLPWIEAHASRWFNTVDRRLGPQFPNAKVADC